MVSIERLNVPGNYFKLSRVILSFTSPKSEARNSVVVHTLWKQLVGA